MYHIKKLKNDAVGYHFYKVKQHEKIVYVFFNDIWMYKEVHNHEYRWLTLHSKAWLPRRERDKAMHTGLYP